MMNGKVLIICVLLCLGNALVGSAGEPTGFRSLPPCTALRFEVTDRVRRGQIINAVALIWWS
jgi:hypothetical protein